MKSDGRVAGGGGGLIINFEGVGFMGFFGLCISLTDEFLNCGVNYLMDKRQLISIQGVALGCSLENSICCVLITLSTGLIMT